MDVILLTLEQIYYCGFSFLTFIFEQNFISTPNMNTTDCQSALDLGSTNTLLVTTMKFRDCLKII